MCSVPHASCPEPTGDAAHGTHDSRGRRSPEKKKEGGLPTCQTSAADWGILFLPLARALWSPGESNQNGWGNARE